MRHDSHDVPRFGNADMNGAVMISSLGRGLDGGGRFCVWAFFFQALSVAHYGVRVYTR